MPTSEPMRPPVHVPSTVLAVKSVLSAGIIRPFSFLIKPACATKASVIFLPRVMGHKRGLDALENMVKHCAKLGVQYLTVFAFSTENWRRPEDEVSFLMGLFLQALQKQVRRLHENNMRLKVLGSRERFNRQILQGIEEAEALTANNTGLTLSIAADYGGRWDILQAANKLIAEGVSEITEDALAKHLPPPF